MSNATKNDPVLETRDRVRRVEMRLTRLMEALNVESGVYRPVWDNGKIIVPSHMASLTDCLRVVPGNWPKDIEVDLVMKDQIIARLKVP